MSVRRRILTAFLLFAALLPAAGLAQSAGESARLAQMEARIQELEELVRRLTGRLEEIEFDQRQVQNRLDQLQSAGQSTAQAAEPPPLVVVRPQTQTGSVTSGGSPNVIVPTTPPADNGVGADGERSLGRISQDALLRVQRPEEELPNEADLEGDSDQRFATFNQLLQRGQSNRARPAIQAFIDDYPEDPRTPQAAFLLGETWFVAESYADAAAQFAENYRAFGPEDSTAPNNLLKLGMALARLQELDRACTAFAELERRYPDAPAPVTQSRQREQQQYACN